MKTTHLYSKQVGLVTINSDINQATILSTRLVLKSFSQYEDKVLMDLCTPFFTKPSNMKLFGEGGPWSLEKIKFFINDEIEKWVTGKRFGCFIAHDKATEAFVGCLFVTHMPHVFEKIGCGHPNATEIGYIVDEAHTGKGIGTELAILGKKYIKSVIADFLPESQEHAIKEILATAHPLNEASKKILKKTLKQTEPEIFSIPGRGPRLLFFKPLKDMSAVVAESAHYPSL